MGCRSLSLVNTKDSITPDTEYNENRIVLSRKDFGFQYWKVKVVVLIDIVEYTKFKLDFLE
jgi:hypothetical protein